MEKTEGSIASEQSLMDREDFMFTYDEGEKQQNEINKANAKLVFSPKFIPLYPKLLDELTVSEALLFGFIDFYKSNSSERMYFSNEELSKILRCSVDTISKAMSKLEKLGYISTSRKIKAGGGQIRFINSAHGGNSISLYKENPKTTIYNNKINNNKNKYTSTLESEKDSTSRWLYLYNNFGISKEEIEIWFDYKKSLETIKLLCEDIKYLSTQLDIIPIYDKDTINATDMMLNNGETLDSIYNFVIENDWDSGVDNYKELIRVGKYLPLDILDSK